MRIVGAIPRGIPAPVLPEFSRLPDFASDAFSIAVVAFAINLSLAKLFAKKHVYSIDSNQVGENECYMSRHSGSSVIPLLRTAPCNWFLWDLWKKPWFNVSSTSMLNFLERRSLCEEKSPNRLTFLSSSLMWTIFHSLPHITLRGMKILVAMVLSFFFIFTGACFLWTDQHRWFHVQLFHQRCSIVEKPFTGSSWRQDPGEGTEIWFVINTY